MSGNSDSTERAVDKMNKAMKLLDEYETQIGLPRHQAPGPEAELEKYFIMDRDTLEAMSVEECGSRAYRLGQFSFYLQREVNREVSRQHWAKTQMDDTIAVELAGYDKFTKYDAKVAMICADNSYAKVLKEIMGKADRRMARLTYLANSVKNLSDILMAIQRAKVSKRYEREN